MKNAAAASQPAKMHGHWLTDRVFNNRAYPLFINYQNQLINHDRIIWYYFLIINSIIQFQN
jgi:hypothetical protein